MSWFKSATASLFLSVTLASTFAAAEPLTRPKEEEDKAKFVRHGKSTTTAVSGVSGKVKWEKAHNEPNFALAGLHFTEFCGHDRNCYAYSSYRRLRDGKGNSLTPNDPPNDNEVYQGRIDVPACRQVVATFKWNPSNQIAPWKHAELGVNNFVRAVQVCTNGAKDSKDKRLKGIRVWAARVDLATANVVETDTMADFSQANCKEWENKVSCPKDQVAYGAEYHAGEDGIAGVALICSAIKKDN